MTPSALAAAYATAASLVLVAPPVTLPVTPPVTPPATGGSPSASGTLAAAGALAGSITPQATGYEITVEPDSISHRFFLTPVAVAGFPTATSTAAVTVTRGYNADGSLGNTSVSYTDPRVALTPVSCDVRVSTGCGVTISTPTGATHPVTLSFNNTPLVGGGTLNGSLVGDAPGALWSPSELPRTTDGAVAINGVSTIVKTSTYTSTTVGSNTQQIVTLQLADGSQVVVGRTNALPFSVTRLATVGGGQCATACNVTLSDQAEGVSVSFANTPLSGGVALNQSVFIGKTQGTLTNNGNLGNFTPISDSVTAQNDSRMFSFSTLGSAAQANISLLSVTVRGGRVTSASATTGIGAALYTCGDALAVLGYPACTGITAGANGRSFTFANATLAGGALGAAKTNVAFTGTLIAKGQ